MNRGSDLLGSAVLLDAYSFNEAPIHESGKLRCNDLRSRFHLQLQ